MATANASAEQATAPEPTPARDLPDPFSAARTAFASEDALAAWRNAATAPADLMVENLQFLSHRLLAHAAFIEELVACRDVGQAAAKQSAFMSSTFDDYRRQSEVLARKLTSQAPAPRARR